MGVGSPYRPDVDGLRAVAVLAVLIYHAFSEILPAGYLGVDVFFVISGYLITQSISQSMSSGNFRLLDFYSRRVRRIFPSLLTMLILVLFAGKWLLLPEEFHSLTKHTTAGIGFISNWFLQGEAGYFDLAAWKKPLLHLWSLSIEEQFYLLWPLFLLTLPGQKSLMTILFTVTLGLVIFFTTPSPYFLTHARIWEIALGGMLVFTPRTQKQNLSLVSLLFLSGVFFVAQHELGHVVTVILTFVILQGEVNFLKHPVLVAIGLISYPLYLWHWPLLSFGRLVSGGDTSIWMRICLLLLSGVLAWGTYRFVELPLRRMRAGKVAFWLLGAGVILGAVSWGTYQYSPRAKLPVVETNDPLKKFDALVNAHPGYVSGLSVQRYSSDEAHFCHMLTAETPLASYFKDHGPDLVFDSYRPNVLVIGDSIAADIHDALKVTHAGYNFLQLTGASCRPCRSYEGQCSELLNYAYRFATHPSIAGVIVGRMEESCEPELEKRIEDWKSLGKKVMVIGPPLKFKEFLPTLLQRRDSRDTRDAFGKKTLSKEHFPLNRELKREALSKDIPYLDMIEQFCSGEDCEFISQEGEPYFYDYMHMTKAGLYFFGERTRARGVMEKWLPPAMDFLYSSPENFDWYSCKLSE